MAVAVGASAYADHQRQQSTDRIIELVEKLYSHKLEYSYHRLEASRQAIDLATTVLLEEGKIGLSLGLDSASYEFNVALTAALSQVSKWQNALDKLPQEPVELSVLVNNFPSIDEDHGEFNAHLETAVLAIALKRCLLVLQAVEHAQLEETENPFTSFIQQLRTYTEGLTDLESGIHQVLYRLSLLELKRPGRLLNKVYYSPAEVDKLLNAAYRLKNLGQGIQTMGIRGDVQIDIEQGQDGSLIVFPATEVPNT